MVTIFFSLLVIGLSILLGSIAYKFSKKRITGSVVNVIVAIALPIFASYPKLFIASIITIVFNLLRLS